MQKKSNAFKEQERRGLKDLCKWVLGCEFLESRAIMENTDPHRGACFVVQGSLLLAPQFYEDYGADKSGWYNHWTQQQGKREFDTGY